ncbi:MAG: CopG family transcriptional regulator [Planctomycetota bacterium]
MNVDSPPKPQGRRNTAIRASSTSATGTSATSTSATGTTVKNTSVTLEPEVLAYLGELQTAADRSRSWLINQIIKQHRASSLQLQSLQRTPLLAGNAQL